MTKVIEIKNLSKKYIISHVSRPVYSTLIETLINKFKGFKGDPTEEFWALKDINLDIHEGDCVGIIGKNGAGKSTLLKILSRITAPTTGSIRIRGKVSSLLEVGTGFHQELTGRENIYLNGIILGMRYKEIEKKFDEIVAFSEIEQFLDTPVKRYSSGMLTRLGFAIAAHLDPDLLIVDEVLAVGDSAFQKKCLEKLNQLGSNGRTVLFVSHDMGAMLTLCKKGIYLENGQIKEIGSIEDCVNAYMKTCKMHDFEWKGIAGDENLRITSARLVKNDIASEFFYQGDKLKLEITYEILKPVKDLYFAVGVWNQRHQLLGRSTTTNTHEIPGMNKLTFFLDTSLFHEGEYLIKLECFIHDVKNILNDEIILKCPIYVPEKETRFYYRDGIFLGNEWEREILNQEITYV